MSAEQYDEGHEVVWAAFSSASASVEVAKGFCKAQQDKDDEPEPRTLIFLKTSHAVCVSPLSHFPKEAEVLMMPGAVFKVGRVGCEAFDQYTNGVRFIEFLDVDDIEADKAKEIQQPLKKPNSCMAPQPAGANPCRAKKSNIHGAQSDAAGLDMPVTVTSSGFYHGSRQMADGAMQWSAPSDGVARWRRESI